MANKTQRISPFLWFNDNAEEAVDFYTSIFKNSKKGIVAYYGEAGSKAAGRPVGSIMTIELELDGQEFTVINGGPHFKFNPAISLVVNCKNQEEIDYYWEKLSTGGPEEQCGWLIDKFGISWQIVPADLGDWMKDTAKADKAMEAVLQMKKLDLNVIKKAWDQG